MDKLRLELKRKYLKERYTIGNLFVNGVYFCDCLEPETRPAGIKINGKTAVPYGTYKIQMTFSRRFQRVLPELLNVPNFEAIRIHSLNRPEETQGCIGVGRNWVKGGLTNSRFYLDKLCLVLSAVKDIEIVIT